MMKRPNAGEKAPDFEFENKKGQSRKLSDLRGKKIILYFYPKDDTPGCTAQACSLRDGYDEFQSNDIEVIGVSADDAKKHQKFADKHSLPFDLVPDTDRNVIEKYGAWGPKKFMGREYDGIIRTTFVIDEDGKIAHIIDKVKTKVHADQIKELINLK